MNKYSGSNFDDFLKEEGIFEEVSLLTQRRLEALPAEDMPGASNRFLQWYQQAVNYLRSSVFSFPYLLVPVAIMLIIGVFYFGNRDSGGTEDANAFKNLQLRADQGEPEAMSLLGDRYYHGGEDVLPNYVEAYKWWSLAEKQSLDKTKITEISEKRDMVVQRMTVDQIAEAKRRAHEWKRAEYNPK